MGPGPGITGGNTEQGQAAHGHAPHAPARAGLCARAGPRAAKRAGAGEPRVLNVLCMVAKGGRKRWLRAGPAAAEDALRPSSLLAGRRAPHLGRCWTAAGGGPGRHRRRQPRRDERPDAGRVRPRGHRERGGLLDCQ